MKIICSFVLSFKLSILKGGGGLIFPEDLPELLFPVEPPELLSFDPLELFALSPFIFKKRNYFEI